MTGCPRCDKTLQWYLDRFEREFMDAQIEVQRLEYLFNDVCWYNFETTCRTWTSPWHTTQPSSTVKLDARRTDVWWNKGQRCSAERRHPWYCGTIRDAPKCPPEMVQAELQEARDYRDACKVQMLAPIEWAPGGALYEELRNRTPFKTANQ